MGTTASREVKDVCELQMVDLTVTWKIKDYSKMPLYTWTRCAPFRAQGLDIYLDLYKGKTLMIRLVKDNTLTHLTKLKCKLSIVDKHGLERHALLHTHSMRKEVKTRVLFTILNFDLEKDKNDILPMDILTVSLNVRALGDDVEDKPPTTITTLETLSNDLERYFDNTTDSDCLLSAGDALFPVHRAVLCARSPVFAAMFRHDTSEKVRGIVDIVDVEAPILRDILLYIYSGKIRGLTEDSVFSMYVAADKYDLLELRNNCLQTILHNLKVENICNAAVLADSHNETELKDAVVKYVGENLDEVVDSAEWRRFLIEKPLLANVILTNAFRTCRNNNPVSN